jgi:hypothetical protein
MGAQHRIIVVVASQGVSGVYVSLEVRREGLPNFSPEASSHRPHPFFPLSGVSFPGQTGEGNDRFVWSAVRLRGRSEFVYIMIKVGRGRPIRP